MRWPLSLASARTLTGLIFTSDSITPKASSTTFLLSVCLYGLSSRKLRFRRIRVQTIESIANFKVNGFRAWSQPHPKGFDLRGFTAFLCIACYENLIKSRFEYLHKLGTRKHSCDLVSKELKLSALGDGYHIPIKLCNLSVGLGYSSLSVLLPRRTEFGIEHSDVPLALSGYGFAEWSALIIWGKIRKLLRDL